MIYDVHIGKLISGRKELEGKGVIYYVHQIEKSKKSFITTMKEYELYILPMYVISSLLMLYSIGFISAYIKHCKQKDKKDNNIL